RPRDTAPVSLRCPAIASRSLVMPSPLGQVSRNGVMPMTAPSFSRTTRAPGGSDTIPAVTVAGAAGEVGGAAAAGGGFAGAVAAGATVTVSDERGIHDPRVSSATAPI